MRDPDDLPWTGGGAESRTGEGPHPRQPLVGERPDADAVDRTVVTQGLHECHHAVVGLGVDVEAGVRERLEQLGERGDGVSVAEAGRRDVGGVQLGDRPARVRDPIEDVVVERHQHAVGAQVDVGLEVAEPLGPRGAERGHGVLGGRLGATPVRHGDRPRTVEERHGELRSSGRRPPSTHPSGLACTACPSGGGAVRRGSRRCAGTSRRRVAHGSRRSTRRRGPLRPRRPRAV